MDYIHPALRDFAVPIDSVTLDPHNARLHDERNLESIQRSLEKFGQRVLLTTTPEGMISKGNGTWLAAKRLGWEHIAVLETEDDPSMATVWALTDNRSSELSAWDAEALGEQLGLLASEGVSTEVAGFREEELIDLVALVAEGKAVSSVASGYSGPMLPLGVIKLNSWNPHVMTRGQMGRLVKSMETVGQVLPIIVRPSGGGKYEIIDGEKRFNAAKELGWDSIKVSFFAGTDDEAKVAAIATGRIRGVFSGDRMSPLVSDLSERGEGFVKAGAGMDSVRLREYQGMEGASVGSPVDEEGYADYRDYKDVEDIGEVYTLLIPLSEEDYELVSGYLTSVSVDWATALVEVVKRCQHNSIEV